MGLIIIAHTSDTKEIASRGTRDGRMSTNSNASTVICAHIFVHPSPSHIPCASRLPPSQKSRRIFFNLFELAFALSLSSRMKCKRILTHSCKCQRPLVSACAGIVVTNSHVDFGVRFRLRRSHGPALSYTIGRVWYKLVLAFEPVDECDHVEEIY